MSAHEEFMARLRQIVAEDAKVLEQLEDEKRYTHTAKAHWEASGRKYGLYGCARRGCDAVNPDWWSFGSRGKSYCLNHRPLLARLRVWWQGRCDA